MLAYGSGSNMESSLIRRYNVEVTLIISAESADIDGEECILLVSNDISELNF